MQKTSELQKHTLFLVKGDYARLQERYPEIGAARIIRALISNHLAKLDMGLDNVKVKTGDLNV